MNVIFMGTPSIAIPALESLAKAGCGVREVYTQPDREQGRKKVKQPSPIKVYAESLGLPVQTPEKIKMPEVLEHLQRQQPHLIIVCAYGQILPQALLEIPSNGCFNVHFSFLPQWRGASPIQAAIRSGVAETGVSLQKIVFRLDAGPLVAQSRPEPIDPSDTSETLGERLSLLSGQLLTATLPSLLNRTLELREQEETRATFCRIIKKEEGLVRWQDETAVEIERKLRAFTPWPGIYSFDTQGRRIQWTQVSIEESVSLPIGVIHQDLMIGAKQGALRILRLKPEGKNEMSKDEFLRGYSDWIGTVLV